MSKTQTSLHPSLRSFVLSHKGLILPRPYCWRLVIDQPVGQIHGLPTCRGIAVATNGILVAIESENQTQVAICHLEWFKCDEENSDLRDLLKKIHSSRERAQEKKKLAMETFNDLMVDFGITNT